MVINVDVQGKTLSLTKKDIPMDSIVLWYSISIETFE